MKNIFLFLTLLGLISGCSITPAHERRPTTSGILNYDIPEYSSKKVQAGPQISLAIILSENTKNSIRYLKATQESDKKDSNNVFNKLVGISDALDASAEVHNPQFFTNAIIKALKKYFGKVVLVDDISNFDKNQYSNLAIIDLYRGHKLLGYFVGADEYSEIKTVFFNSSREYINTAKGIVSERINGEEIQEINQQIYEMSLKSVALWEADLANIIEAPSGAAFNYDNCIRQAIAVKDKSLKTQAMKACEQ